MTYENSGKANPIKTLLTKVLESFQRALSQISFNSLHAMILILDGNVEHIVYNVHIIGNQVILKIISNL